MYIVKRNLLRFTFRLLLLYLVTLISGCGSNLSFDGPEPKEVPNRKIIEKAFRKKLGLLPYIKYVPLIEPTENSQVLLDQLSVLEVIVDDHILYKKQKDIYLKQWSLRRIKIPSISNIFNERENSKETLDEKIAEIKSIRSMTSRYENWFPKWSEKVDIVQTKISIDEIDLVKSEINRIAKKL